MKRILYLILPMFLLTVGSVYSQDLCAPVGWATQSMNVTGGGNATPVVVHNYTEFKNALKSSSVKVVHISGTIAVPAGGLIYFQDQADKTIFGLPGSKLTSSDQTSGGSGILIVKRCKNIIIRNVTFEGPGAYDVDGYDNLLVSQCTNVWVDHCSFYDGVDGNFDINNGSDLISVTWCKFGYNKAPLAGGSGGSNDHRFTNLIGSSDSATGDRGKLRITFQNCWWAPGCKARMPRVRFGKVHVVNNYFNSTASAHCIQAAYEANLLIEGNVFENVKNPVDLMNNSFTAVTVRNNQFTGSTSGTRSGSGTAFTPPYNLKVADPGTIVAPITSCAGATLPGPSECSSCSTSQGDSNASTGLAASLVKHGTGSSSQNIDLGESIVDFYYDWTNASTVEVNGLPAGIDVAIDNTAQTVSFSGTPTEAGSFNYTLTTAGGNPEASLTANITVNEIVAPNIAPVVAITSPADNSTFTTSNDIIITANASDSDGSIARVEFYNGSSLLSTDSSSPYAYTWTNVAFGTYTITAKAYDNEGASSLSSVVVVVEEAIVPVTLQASAGDGVVSLSWTLNNISPNVIQVLRDTDPDRSGRVRIAYVTSGSTFKDTNVTNGTTYYYWIKITDTSGNLIESGSASATPIGTSSGVAASLIKHGAGSSSQTINLGESIVSFYYDWFDANTVTVTGMPEGVQVDIDNTARQVVFSGTPTKSGVFAYTVTTVGGNPEAVKNGTFTVNAGSTQSRLGENSSNTNEPDMPELENLSLKVYPNPVENTLTIEGKFDGNWMLFDMQNRKVMEGSQPAVQMEGMKQGIYILKVEEKVIRIIKND